MCPAVAPHSHLHVTVAFLIVFVVIYTVFYEICGTSGAAILFYNVCVYSYVAALFDIWGFFALNSYRNCHKAVENQSEYIFHYLQRFYIAFHCFSYCHYCHITFMQWILSTFTSVEWFLCRKLILSASLRIERARLSCHWFVVHFTQSLLKFTIKNCG